jgi:hypothetical protein
MKLVRARVNWAEGWMNDPNLEILVDKMPEVSELRYKYRCGLYYAELDGYVSFYSYTSPGEGFDGRIFNITMENGEKKSLHGPWSSRAAVMNSAGFGPCLDVSITDDLKSYERGYTFYSGHVTLDLIEKSKHIVEIGPGYNKKCGFVEFPRGSVLTFFKQDDELYSPAVMFPEGKIWTKNV